MITLTKSHNNAFVPSDESTIEWASTVKLGETVRTPKPKKMRNPKFHRKYFALLNIGFDNWEPQTLEGRYGIPEKNFDRFRKDVVILCGYYDVVVRLDGSTRIEPKSISFSSMDDEEFGQLYSKTIDVLIKNVYSGKITPDEMNNLVEQYLSFA